MDLHQIALHVVNVAGDESVKVVVDAALQPAKDLVRREVARRFGLAVDDPGEVRILKLEFERVKETVAALSATLTERAAENPNWKTITDEADEPSTRRFVSDAFDASASTTLESKRMLIGVLIARRLEAKTDSDEEILLRRALTTVEDLSENQLRILAAASLVQMPPIHREQIFFPSLDAAEKYLHDAYFRVARQLKNTLWLDEDEFGALVSVGAVRLQDEGNALVVSEDAPPFDQWLHQFVKGPDAAMLAVGSDADFGKRYPTIVLFQTLASGWQRGEHNSPRRLDSIRMTPLGTYVAHVVLRRLTGWGTSPPSKLLVFQYDGTQGS
jgi:hypothetical protein